MNLNIKRVYEPAEKSDGYRVLVDKLWPRGIKKENLPFDLWMKEAAPSPALRKWYHEDTATRWEEFKKRYRRELETSPGIQALLTRIQDKKTVTLLYASKNAAENHALILRDFLREL